MRYVFTSRVAVLYSGRLTSNLQKYATTLNQGSHEFALPGAKTSLPWGGADLHAPWGGADLHAPWGGAQRSSRERILRNKQQGGSWGAETSRFTETSRIRAPRRLGAPDLGVPLGLGFRRTAGWRFSPSRSHVAGPLTVA